MDVSPHDVRRALTELGKLRFGEMRVEDALLRIGHDVVARVQIVAARLDEAEPVVVHQRTHAGAQEIPPRHIVRIENGDKFLLRAAQTFGEGTRLESKPMAARDHHRVNSACAQGAG